MSYLAEAGTFSKSPRCWGLPDNIYTIKGEGSHVTLSNHVTYLDWVSSLGQNLLGYDAKFYGYVSECIKGGVGFSLVHRIEIEVAEKLCLMLQQYVPGWLTVPLKARFCKTGSEATMMAVRLAKAVTKKNKIGMFEGHYHGWLDWTISRVQPCWGIHPEERFRTIPLVWDDPKTFEQYDFNKESVAATIFEHPSFNVKTKNWYNLLRQKADETKSLLIADEVVTGLRYGLGGACEFYNIRPDLVCMGKAMGNGFPIAAVVGPAEYMDWFSRTDPVFCSSTTWGETSSLYAANYVLDNFGDAEVSYIWMLGNNLINGIRKAGWDIFGHPPRSVMRFTNDKERAFFIKYMFENDILMNRPNFPNVSHNNKDIVRTVSIAKTGRGLYNSLLESNLNEYIAGRMPKVLFSNR